VDAEEIRPESPDDAEDRRLPLRELIEELEPNADSIASIVCISSVGSSRD
jgi:hypothetical protein